MRKEGYLQRAMNKEKGRWDAGLFEDSKRCLQQKATTRQRPQVQLDSIIYLKSFCVIEISKNKRVATIQTEAEQALADVQGLAGR